MITTNCDRSVFSSVKVTTSNELASWCTVSQFQDACFRCEQAKICSFLCCLCGRVSSHLFSRTVRTKDRTYVKRKRSRASAHPNYDLPSILYLLFNSIIHSW